MEAINDAAARAETQITGTGANFRDQLEHIQGGLQGQIEDINRGLLQITAQLERTGASLRSTTVGAVADVERVGQRFEQTSSQAAEQIEARHQQMRIATDEAAKLVASLGSHFEQVVQRMAAAGNNIKSQEGGALNQLQATLGHLGTIAEKLEATREMSGSVTQHAIARLDDVVNAVQAHMNNMTAARKLRRA